MTQKQPASTWPTRDLLLLGEVGAWTGYWTMLSERTTLRTEVFRLKEEAFGATKAVQDHVANCVVCSKSRIKIYYLPEAERGRMTDLIKYPGWQPEYFAAVMEGNIGLLRKKVYRAEVAILNRHLALASCDGTDYAAELNALADAVKEIRVLKTEKLKYPEWK